MKNFYKNLLLKYPILGNVNIKYLVVLVFFIIWMLFLDSYSALQHKQLNKEIDKLEDSKVYYNQEIEKDKKEIKSYQSLKKIEKFAREKYYMKKQNEDIFIIEDETETDN